MFIINTTTSVEFDQNLWCLSQILTDFGQIPQILSGDFGWRVVLWQKAKHRDAKDKSSSEALGADILAEYLN